MMMDDLISRQNAINTALEFFVEFLGGAFHEDDQKILMKRMNKLPDEGPERKTAEWIEFDSGEDKYDIIKCSHCKHIFNVDSYHWSDIGLVKDDFNFCPNCGIKMER